jgi:transcriptional regulator with XRE-family HTH domain
MTRRKITRMFLARVRMGLTQADIAEAIGVSQPKISAWERGQVDVPEARRAQIAKLLDTPRLTLTDEV